MAYGQHALVACQNLERQNSDEARLKPQQLPLTDL